MCFNLEKSYTEKPSLKSNLYLVSIFLTVQVKFGTTDINPSEFNVMVVVFWMKHFLCMKICSCPIMVVLLTVYIVKCGGI